MKKSYFYTLAVFTVIIMVGLISVITNYINPPCAYAFDPGFVATAPGWWYAGENLINDFDQDRPAQYPPIGPRWDYRGWNGMYDTNISASAYPTPVILNCDGTGCGSTVPDYNFPNPAHGTSFGRVEWTGVNLYNPQYIHLTNYANVTSGDYGTNFENVGCGAVTTTAGNWSCYGYFRVFAYLSFGANGGTPSTVSQTVSLYDGSVTVTSNGVKLDPLGGGSGGWDYHISVSLNYLANQYFPSTGRYFSVSNVADIILNAPQTDYSNTLLRLPSVPTAFPTPNSRSIILYYDYVTLGASTDLPLYESPSNVTVKTGVGGALIAWNLLTPSNYNAAVPITGYHIYRSLSSTYGTGQWVSVGVAKGAGTTSFTDKTVLGGHVYCYKVLTTNCGPTTLPDDEKLNTINASYNEPLLQDSIVSEACGFVDIQPTQTPIDTPFLGSPTMTSTPGGPTPTNTPLPTVAPDIKITDAHVYPNPFNPNMGQKVFNVTNVKPNTKIHIYAMDGSLVKDGITSGSGGSASNSLFKWDGRNKNGSQVVSGLYYLVLEDPQKKTAIFRVIVCYKCDPVYKPQP
jgi:hypothetical protein